jgi:hypothetical protein
MTLLNKVILGARRCERWVIEDAGNLSTRRAANGWDLWDQCEGSTCKRGSALWPRFQRGNLLAPSDFRSSAQGSCDGDIVCTLEAKPSR